MAQLPPKVPNWQQFPHQRIQQQQNPSWVDEFLDFSSTRRGSHRRSISDSVAFLETGPLMDECRNVSAVMMHGISNNGGGGFDRLDDEQLMSMFSDDVTVAVPSNPSTPSDQNSNNDDKSNVQSLQHCRQEPKHEPGEVESSFDSQAPPLCATVDGCNSAATAAAGDNYIDPKRIKRILANRQSAQRSRVRKLQYISELERSVTSLQTEVSALSPRVAYLDHQRLILNVDNSALKQRIAALAQDKIFKDAHQEMLKTEIERLRQIHHQQSLKKMNNNNSTTTSTPPPSAPPPSSSGDNMKVQMECKSSDEEKDTT